MPTPTYRDAVTRYWPWGSISSLARRVLYAMSSQLDVLGNSLSAGLKLRFPGYYTDALPLLGRERRIRRGRVETSEAYAARLRGWLGSHQLRGGPYALLEQLYAVLPVKFPIDLVFKSGRRFRMDTLGNITRDIAPMFLTLQWARWTLYYYTNEYATPTTQDLEDLTSIPKEWNAAHCQGKIIILPTGAELWNYPSDNVWDEPGVWNTTPVTVLEI